MTFLWLVVGLVLPTLTGWTLLRLLEGSHPVLFPLERTALGCILGLVLTMFFVFVIHVMTGAPLTLMTFALVQCGALLPLGILQTMLHVPHTHKPVAPHTEGHMPEWLKHVFGILLLWITIKTLVASVTFLLLIPSYFDDSVTNWNLRAKVFFYDHALTLVMPAESPLTSPLGISSYPPSVPMMKTWLALLVGRWDEALINSIHIVWYVCALILVYFAVRRHASHVWGLFAIYLLGSIPLSLMHGTNAYADAFLSVHIFASISMLLHAARAHHTEARMSYFRIAALCIAALPFTKNEGMIVYLPPLLLILCLILRRLKRTQQMTGREVAQVLLWHIVGLLLIAGPWLAFKWMHGLSFGNAKPFTSLTIGWQENVLLSIFINTFFEGNWLFLLPLLFGLLLWQWRRAFTTLLPVTLFFLILYCGQALLYLFTGLSTEALRQTGYARGLVQITPVMILLCTLLLESGIGRHLPLWARLQTSLGSGLD